MIKTNTARLAALEAQRAAEVEAENERIERPSLAATAPANDANAPTFADPLRGLAHLSKVAVIGRSRLLELAAQPVTYVWQDIAVAGTIVLVAGPPAEGKTTLLFLLLAARMNLNANEPVTLLSRTVWAAPPQTYVVIIEGEHSEGSTARKLRRTMRLVGVDEDALDRVIVLARKAVQLRSPEWGDIVKLIKLGLVSDIAIDTIARVAPADADNEREQVAIFSDIAAAIDAGPAGAQPTAWIIAHTRKGGDGAGDLASVSGSAQRVGQADSVLMVKGEKVDGRTVATTVTFAKLREDPEEYPLPVTFSIVKDEDGERLETRGKDEDARPIESRILDLLAVEPRSKNALKTALRRSGADVDAALSVLFSGKHITTREDIVRGKPCKLFALRPVGNLGGPRTHDR